METAKNRKPQQKKSSLTRETWHRLKKNRLAMIGLFIILFLIIVAIFAPLIAPFHYDDQNIGGLLEFPSKEFPFGTDNFGRDIFSRMIYGSRISLSVGFISVVFSSIIGCLLGAIAAYYRKFDNILMRLIDIIAGIPYLLLAIAISAALGTGLRNIIIAVGISAVPAYARITRATFLTIQETEYIEAARSIGANNFRIIMKHIFPNSLSPIIVQATLSCGNAIVLAAALSFMGLGIQPPSPEWGAMLSAGRIFIRDYWHMTVIPGVALIIVVYSLNTLGDGLRDALDPRLKN